MPETIGTPWVVLIFAMVAVWFVLSSWLFHRLRKRHASTYEAMGSPGVFWNNSWRSSWLFMKFLFGSQWRELADPAVAIACRFMRVFLIAYILLFLGRAIPVFSGALSPH